MWYDSEKTKQIAQMLNLIEVGANNGWMDSNGEYYNQCLEKDKRAIKKLTFKQKRILSKVGKIYL